MEFTVSPKIEETCRNIKAFVDDHIIPLESDPANFDAHENIAAEPLERLKNLAKQQGIWSLSMPKDWGGQGYTMAEIAPCYEEMNRAIFGPVCFNASAPDDGNMRVLSQVAREDQKEKWLRPIIEGKIRSSFIMTEPHPGSGSDPMMMRTKAEKKGGKWIINGHKWYITGAETAEHFILMARTSDDPRRGLTAFLFHRDTPGWRIERRIEIMGPEEHGGHCELFFENMEIPDEDRLMEVGDGLKVTQIRLGPARLTHCMRWLGLCKRSLEIATEYVNRREGFGMKLADRESVQFLLGEAAMDIQISRMLVMHAAWKLDQGDFARKEVSMAKIHAADTLHKAVDTAIQLNGARGYSKDTVLEWIYRYARQARLVDGASEVHKMVLARNLYAQGNDFWSWG
ncbi:MAG: acyl-CoA dehydrogenase family protein [Alphaproteobacteria bacterium]|nr:acyl-CoA dehydrogenase family protein [Alphaproteobacteria bacterium]